MRRTSCLLFMLCACESPTVPTLLEPHFAVTATDVYTAAGVHILPPLGAATEAVNDPTLLARLSATACALPAGACVDLAVRSNDEGTHFVVELEDGGTQTRLQINGDGSELAHLVLAARRPVKNLKVRFRVEAGAIVPPPAPPVSHDIVFVGLRDDNYDIYTIKADGTAETRLTSVAADDYWPGWSPDGSRIVFSRNDQRAGVQFDIYAMNADGSAVTRLTSTTAYDAWPRYSPDGTRIAFARDHDIWVMNADGTAPVQLTFNSGYDVNPEWSPDGSRILYRRQVDGNWDLYVMNADGSGSVRLTTQAGIDYDGDWSPDGSRIVYWANVSGQDGLWIMNADGTNQHKLPQNGQRDMEPAWSSDGTQIVFSSATATGNQLWIMNADGSGARKLTAGSYDVQPRWR